MHKCMGFWKYNIENPWILLPPARVAHIAPRAACFLRSATFAVCWVSPFISFWKGKGLLYCIVPSVWLLFLSLALWIVTIRFQQIRDLGRASHLNTASLVLGFISSIGISILGNFQVQFICVVNEWKLLDYMWIVLCLFVVAFALKPWYT